MTTGQQGWHPPMPPDGPVSPTTPVRPITGTEAPPLALFDAVGMQSVLTRARDQSRFVAPVLEDEQKKRPLPVKGLMWGLMSVVALGFIIGLVYVNFFRVVPEDPDTIVKPVAPPSDAAEVIVTTTPQEIVQRYFDALATGRPDQALAMGERNSDGSQELLTGAVFDRARELRPISDLEILSDDQLATEIPVRYRLGGVPYEMTVSLEKDDAGSYRLARTTASAEFSVPGGQNLPIFVNGHKIDPSKTYELLPGMYEVTTGLPFIEYTEASHLEVPGLARENLYTVNVLAQLTQEGEAAFIDAARKSLNDCLAQARMSPEGCPNRATSLSPVGINESTVRWRLTNNPWANASPSLTAEDQSIAMARVSISANLSFFYNTTGSANSPVTQRAEVRAAMAGEDSAKIEVTWSGA